MLLSLVYINCDYLQAQTTIPRFEEGERVVFVGNSITHGGHYHSFIWLYYMTRFPDKPITIMNAGIGGESAWDMKDRITSKQYVEGGLQLRVISEIQPELECMSIPATLEDAYIYVTNQYE